MDTDLNHVTLTGVLERGCGGLHHMTPTTPPVTATAVVPPHVGSGPLTVLQLNCARVRIATEMLTQVVQALEGCPASIRQRACEALAAVVELQAALQAQA